MKSITFLTHLAKGYPVQRYLGSWGSEFRGKIRVRHYFGLRLVGRSVRRRVAQRLRAGRTGTLRRELASSAAGVYVFADIERLTGAEKSKVDSLWHKLAAGDDPPRVLNQPSRILDRFSLLRMLYEVGINNFNAYLPEEGIDPQRWPVFIRHRRWHAGVLAGLIANAEELKAVIDGLVENAYSPGELLIVEFRDTSDSSGITRKYGAFKVGDHIFGRHIHFARDWFLRNPDIKTPESTREELRYVRSDDHHELLDRVFTLSGVDYGRLDYTVQDGQFYFWEINTNPMILISADRQDALRFDAHDHFAERFREALEDL